MRKILSISLFIFILYGNNFAQQSAQFYGLLKELRCLVCQNQDLADSYAPLAQDLRRQDVTVAVNFSGRRLGDQIRQADKMRIPFVIAVGAKERESGRYLVKNLESGQEITLPADRISEHLFSSLG